ncbi:hypothetical protein LINGRAHAP2_LOCUS23233, partial [Linum grandiflorum]
SSYHTACERTHTACGSHTACVSATRPCGEGSESPSSFLILTMMPS